MILLKRFGPLADELTRIFSEQLSALEDPLIEGLSVRVMDQAMSDEFLNEIREPMVKAIAAQIGKEIDATKKEYADLSAKLKKEYETKIAELNASLATVNATVTTLTTDVASQDRKHRSERTDLNARVDMLSSAVSTSATTLNQQVSSAVNVQNEKLTQIRKDLESQIKTVQDLITGLTSKLEGVSKELVALKQPAPLVGPPTPVPTSGSGGPAPTPATGSGS